ncbi:MAG: DPP IV N-terminal domain-containing protein [bacterium]
MRSAARAAGIALVALFLAASSATAQFGKNKVQYKDFRWYTVTTDHFNVYYYKGEEESALRAARMAERAYARLSRILRHEIEDRVPVIVYASHSDFQQTNITPGLIPEGVGGITEFTKRRVFLPFTGSYGEFDHVLTHELTHAFQADILFGGGTGSDVNPLSFQLPLWFDEGMAEYLSIGGLDPNTEMWLRWSALDGQLIPLPDMERIYDIRVYRIGQAIFDFVGTRFGDEKIGELLRKAVYYRSLDIAFEKTLGMDLETLNDEWTDWVRRRYYPQIANLQRPETYGRRLIKKKGFQGVDVAPALSPDGDRVVFLRDGEFSKDLVLASAVDGKVLATLVRGERSSSFESLRYLYTAIGWSPDGARLAFPSKHGAGDVLNILDVDSKHVLKSLKLDFDELYSPCWDPTGRKIAFAGIRAGKSDLYVVDVESGRVEQLTDDPYLARDPQWSPDGTTLAYVTDQGEGTDVEHLIFGKPRIALLDVASRTVTILPGQAGKNIAPQWGPDGHTLAFVSDRTGISDLYVQDLRTDQLHRLTNLITGVTGITDSSPPFSWSRDGRRIVFTTFTGDGWELYAIDDPLDKMRDVVTPEPLERMAEQEKEQSVPWAALDVTPTASPKAAPAAAPEDLSSLLAREPALTLAGPGGAGAAAPGSATSPGKEGSEERIVLSHVFRETTYELPNADSLSGSPYRLKWSPDFLGASPLFASNVGFAGSAQVAISDILSNHVIQIGAAVYGSLQDSDLLLAYYNLKSRTNWGVAVYQFRNDFGVFTAEDAVEFQSQIFRGIQGTLIRPFSTFSRIELTAQAVAFTRQVFDQSFSGGFLATNQSTSDLLYYGGPQVALVTDNVVWGALSPVHGHRARLSNEQAFGDVQFNTTIGDYRQYFPLGRTTVFAWRLVGGVSAGQTPQIFRVGGSATLRGLDYGELDGSTLGLANFELRFPLVETLRLGWPLRVGLGGVGGVLFFDAGGAWSNSARVFRDGRLDDVAAGYGVGFRLGLGYFALKYDIAQRTDLHSRIGKSTSYFSIGLDF